MSVAILAQAIFVPFENECAYTVGPTSLSVAVYPYSPYSEVWSSASGHPTCETNVEPKRIRLTDAMEASAVATDAGDPVCKGDLENITNEVQTALAPLQQDIDPLTSRVDKIEEHFVQQQRKEEAEMDGSPMSWAARAARSPAASGRASSSQAPSSTTASSRPTAAKALAVMANLR